jgi:UPF0755 protein
MVFAGRALASTTVVDVAEQRDGLLRNEIVRDFVRSTVGDAISQPLRAEAAPRNFVVEQGDTANAVAKRLTDENLITRPIVFLLALYESGRENALQAGTYRVSPAMTPTEFAEVFQRALSEQLVLRIGEGWRMSEIAAEVEKRFPTIKAADFAKAAVAGSYSYGFLKDVPPGTPLEGYLFPDTYFFSTDVTADDIIRTLLDTFDSRAGSVLATAAERRKVRIADIVTIASIVEREARARHESPLIASVYWNRVAINMRLEADPTVQYAIGSWREPLLPDLQVDSPYNTYRNSGLPPTPICVPGDLAIRGAAEPATSDFFFFVAKNDGTGEHAFARTLEEHERNRVRYGNR